MKKTTEEINLGFDTIWWRVFGDYFMDRTDDEFFPESTLEPMIPLEIQMLMIMQPAKNEIYERRLEKYEKVFPSTTFTFVD